MKRRIHFMNNVYVGVCVPGHYIKWIFYYSIFISYSLYFCMHSSTYGQHQKIANDINQIIVNTLSSGNCDNIYVDKLGKYKSKK